MSVFTSFAGTLQADVIASGSPQIAILSMPTASTEYSITLPTGCRQFQIKLRSSAALQLSYILGQSGSTYITVPRHCFYAESDLKLDGTVTIYVQSTVASQELEVLAWV
jgi:hypothetical protein